MNKVALIGYSRPIIDLLDIVVAGPISKNACDLSESLFKGYPNLILIFIFIPSFVGLHVGITTPSIQVYVLASKEPSLKVLDLFLRSMISTTETM